MFYQLPRYYDTADTWRFYHLSLTETKWLLNDPTAFAKDLFTFGYTEAGGIFSGTNSYWNDLKSNVIIKLLAVFNLLTHNSYFANIILCNFFFMFGLVALFRVFLKIFTERKWLMIAGIFLIPSTLFWCSGIHKDGFILSATGLLIFYFDHAIRNQYFSLKAAALMLCCLALIFVLRNYVALALLPALLGWWLSHKFRQRVLLSFATIYSAGIILFFTLPLVSGGLNFPKILADKQHEFLALSGRSAVVTNPLVATLEGYVNYLPGALNMAFVQPVADSKNLTTIPAFSETICIYLLLVLCIFYHRETSLSNPALWFFIFFATSFLLIAGYTVTFAGAIIRYRSFALPFLVCPLLGTIDFAAIHKQVKKLQIVSPRQQIR